MFNKVFSILVSCTWISTFYCNVCSFKEKMARGLSRLNDDGMCPKLGKNRVSFALRQKQHEARN